MLRLLFVSKDKNIFQDMIAAIKGYEDIDLELSDSGEKALATIPGKDVDLVVADEDLGDMTGLEMVGKMLKINFMINSAVVSELSPDEFHEASEGLGVMAQLPGNPGKEDAEVLIKTLKQIKGLIT